MSAVQQAERYIVTLPGVPGAHREAETVTVSRLGRLGPNGLDLYTDAGNSLTVEITHETARPVPGTGADDLPPVLHAHPLP
ncbi:DUF6296 family protein [Streptomyces sp. TLI_171]|uniref:DUF6296 family protein n=1 Tax=Streptomyces sp. TLI_171 TaxID=1938859 RepID=UPI000C19E431|nr:DUF6296 family protein [Streptomyces sp. TLI_171]RKE05174.1 hypothetical protein BX266_7442 [Streptomyces sp. TLI_171]